MTALVQNDHLMDLYGDAKYKQNIKFSIFNNTLFNIKKCSTQPESPVVQYKVVIQPVATGSFNVTLVRS